jgi:hypothetical protein
VLVIKGFNGFILWGRWAGKVAGFRPAHTIDRKCFDRSCLHSRASIFSGYKRKTLDPRVRWDDGRKFEAASTTTVITCM